MDSKLKAHSAPGTPLTIKWTEGSLGGYEVAIGFGERFRGLETLDDLALARMREGLSPLDLRPDDPVPVTLKAPAVRSAKR